MSGVLLAGVWDFHCGELDAAEAPRAAGADRLEVTVVEAAEALLEGGDRGGARVQRQPLTPSRSQPPAQLGDSPAGVGVGMGEEDRIDVFQRLRLALEVTGHVDQDPHARLDEQ
jgi:hypothetical protein